MCRWGGIDAYHIAPEETSIKEITKSAYKNLAQEKVAGLAKVSKFHDRIQEAITAGKITAKMGYGRVNDATHFLHSRCLCRCVGELGKASRCRT